MCACVLSSHMCAKSMLSQIISLTLCNPMNCVYIHLYHEAGFGVGCPYPHSGMFKNIDQNTIYLVSPTLESFSFGCVHAWETLEAVPNSVVQWMELVGRGLLN